MRNRRRNVLGLTWLMVGLLAIVLAACGGGGGEPAAAPAESADTGEQSAAPAGDAAAGAETFAGLCAACHGPDGKGVQGLGKDLTTSEFAAGLSDAELAAFIVEGRPASDPANTTGVDMPPKGGNPSLTDEDIANVVAYVRTLGE